MKYKIGNVEVEAVQWKGDNNHELGSFVAGWGVDLEVEYVYGQKNIKIDNKILYKGSYLVVINGSNHIFAEHDFNNMATKVKEPKFKVGDVVYYIMQNGDENFDCDKLIVEDIKREEGEFYYQLDGVDYDASESNLFTLEEAIEKLKEL